jgi:hypothetical protein
MLRIRLSFISPIMLVFLVILCSCALQSQRPSVNKMDPHIVATATQADIWGSEQATDGKLLLFIEEIEKKCHSKNEPIQIKLAFVNLTNDPLALLDRFSIAANINGQGGNIVALLLAEDGKPLYTPADFQMFDIFEKPERDFKVVSPDSPFETKVEYKLPQGFLDMSEIDQTVVTPTPGPYKLKLIYAGNGFFETWHGVIASNQIEICITQ